MDVIAHTASVKPNKASLEAIRDNPFYDKLELDFRLTKDSLLVWSHSDKIDGSLISETNYRNLDNALTLEDVLEILNNAKPILLDIKAYPKNIRRQAYCLLQALTILVHYKNEIGLASFNEKLISFLLKMQENGELNFIDIGLVINLFKTFKYRKQFPKELENIKFVSLSNELFEWPIVGEDYQMYRNMLNGIKQYAWSWDAVYEETEKRISNYILKGVDGIITSKPELVRKLVK